MWPKHQHGWEFDGHENHQTLPSHRGAFKWPIEKTHQSFGTYCRIMVGLSGNELFRTWKRLQTLLTKMSLTKLI